jgi:hypothetical protein
MILMVLAACQSMDKGDTKKVDVKGLPDVREFDDVRCRGTCSSTMMRRSPAATPASDACCACPAAWTRFHSRGFQTNMLNDGWKMVSERAPQSP